MIRQGIVAIDEVNLGAVRVEHLLHRRMRAEAERALEVRELDELDGRARRTLRRAVARRDFLARRFERDLHRRLRLELVDVPLIGRRAPLLNQERSNRRAHLLECGTLYSRLIGRVPRRHVRVGHRLNLRRDFLIDERRARHTARLGFHVDQLLARKLLDRISPRLVQRQHQLHRAEVVGRLLHRLLIDIRQREGDAANGCDDVARALRLVRLLRMGGARHQKKRRSERQAELAMQHHPVSIPGSLRLWPEADGAIRDHVRHHRYGGRAAGHLCRIDLVDRVGLRVVDEEVL